MPKRKKYDAAFKLEVLEYASQSSNYTTARHFSINEKQVRDWKKIEEELRNMPKQKCANRGSVCRWPQLENEISTWVEHQRALGYTVSRAMTRQKALDWAKSHPDQSIDFEATLSWSSRFLKRKKLTLPQQRTFPEKLPRDLEDKVDVFQSMIIKKRKENKYKLSHIGNMDEISMFFDNSESKSINGEKSVLIPTTGHEKCHFSVVLSCMADGTKLTPMVILRSETIPNELFPIGIIVHTHSTGWMDEAGCVKWVKQIWDQQHGILPNEKSLLVWDRFKCHLADDVNKQLAIGNTDTAVIPGGLTSILQPVEVSLSKPFKDAMQQRWHDWTLSGKDSRSGCNTHLSASDLSQWIIDSWDEVKSETVIDSFKMCKISSDLDRTEDDNIVWQDNDDQQMTESGSEDDPYDDLLTLEA